MDASIRVKLWRVPARDVPADDAVAAEWLRGWWRRIDGWILERHGRAALPDAAARAVTDGDEPETEADELGREDGQG